MVSHLRKMGSLNGERLKRASSRKRMSPLIPLFTGPLATQQTEPNLNFLVA